MSILPAGIGIRLGLAADCTVSQLKLMPPSDPVVKVVFFYLLLSLVRSLVLKDTGRTAFSIRVLEDY